MSRSCFRTSPAIVYRRVGEELAVIQVDTGEILYFNLETKALLDFFLSPRTLADYVAKLGKEASDTASYLQDFCEFLSRHQILEPAEAGPETSSGVGVSDAIPVFLRKEEKKIEELVRPMFLRKEENKLENITFLY